MMMMMMMWWRRRWWSSSLLLSLSLLWMILLYVRHRTIISEYYLLWSLSSSLLSPFCYHSHHHFLLFSSILDITIIPITIYYYSNSSLWRACQLLVNFRSEVIKEGDPGDAFFIIRSGDVSCLSTTWHLASESLLSSLARRGGQGLWLYLISWFRLAVFALPNSLC